MIEPKRKEAIRNTLQSVIGLLAESGFESSARIYAFAMLFLKCVSDVAPGVGGRLTIPSSSRFELLLERRSEASLQARVERAFASLEAENPMLGGVFEQLSFGRTGFQNSKHTDSVLGRLIHAFSGEAFAFRGTPAEELRCVDFACDTLIELADERRRSESFTPREVADLVSRIINPEKGELICDPCCGVGTFLMACQRRASGDIALFGQEIDGSSWAIAKMNLIMRGQFENQIERGDTLRFPRLLDSRDKLRKFDAVVAMPPFGWRDWGQEQAMCDPYNRYRRGTPPRFSAEFAFISHMVETLNPMHGRGAVVVPFGVLFRGGAEKQIRERLLRENLVDAVIALPPKLLAHTSIPVAIVILKVGRADRDVFFIDAGRSFQAGRTRNLLTEHQIERIENTHRQRLDVPRFARKVQLEEIFSHETSLNVARYIDMTEVDSPVDLVALSEERLLLTAELSELEARMSELLARTGPALSGN